MHFADNPAYGGGDTEHAAPITRSASSTIDRTVRISAAKHNMYFMQQRYKTGMLVLLSSAVFFRAFLFLGPFFPRMFEDLGVNALPLAELTLACNDKDVRESAGACSSNASDSSSSSSSANGVIAVASTDTTGLRERCRLLKLYTEGTCFNSTAVGIHLTKQCNKREKLYLFWTPLSVSSGAIFGSVVSAMLYAELGWRPAQFFTNGFMLLAIVLILIPTSIFKGTEGDAADVFFCVVALVAGVGCGGAFPVGALAVLGNDRAKGDDASDTPVHLAYMLAGATVGAFLVIEMISALIGAGIIQVGGYLFKDGRDDLVDFLFRGFRASVLSVVLVPVLWSLKRGVTVEINTTGAETGRKKSELTRGQVLETDDIFEGVSLRQHFARMLKPKRRWSLFTACFCWFVSSLLLSGGAVFKPYYHFQWVSSCRRMDVVKASAVPFKKDKEVYAIVGQVILEVASFQLIPFCFRFIGMWSGISLLKMYNAVHQQSFFFVLWGLCHVVAGGAYNTMGHTDFVNTLVSGFLGGVLDCLVQLCFFAGPYITTFVLAVRLVDNPFGEKDLSLVALFVGVAAAFGHLGSVGGFLITLSTVGFEGGDVVDPETNSLVFGMPFIFTALAWVAAAASFVPMLYESGSVTFAKRTDRVHRVRATSVQAFMDTVKKDELEVDSRDISEMTKIASGGAGRVYTALYQESTVCVKILFQGFGEAEDDQGPGTELIKEVENLRKLHHPNIIQFYGLSRLCDDDGFTSYGMITEYCQGGDLHNAIVSGDLAAFDHALRIARQLVNTMAWLHARGVVHRDIKPQNVLLNSDKTQIKICDLGAAARQQSKSSRDRRKSQNRRAHNEGLETVGTTPVYAAPEVLQSLIDEGEGTGGEGAAAPLSRHPTTVQSVASSTGASSNNTSMQTMFVGQSDSLDPKKMDVYSVAVTICQLFSQLDPYSDNRLSDTELMTAIRCQDLRPQLPSEEAVGTDLLTLIKKMWSKSPKSRPDMTTVSLHLKNLNRVNMHKYDHWGSVPNRFSGRGLEDLFEAKTLSSQNSFPRELTDFDGDIANGDEEEGGIELNARGQSLLYELDEESEGGPSRDSSASSTQLPESSGDIPHKPTLKASQSFKKHNDKNNAGINPHPKLSV